jgi:hypothetical protein
MGVTWYLRHLSVSSQQTSEQFSNDFSNHLSQIALSCSRFASSPIASNGTDASGITVFAPTADALSPLSYPSAYISPQKPSLDFPSNRFSKHERNLNHSLS